MASNTESPVTSRCKKRKFKRAASQNGNPKGGTAGPLAQKLALDAEGSSNGKTRTLDGILQYRSKNGWIPAVYHADIRAELLAEGPQGTYDFPRKQGQGENDVTSFHPSYKSHGPDRESRHKILFVYEPPEELAPSYTPETWMYRGHIVLDLDNDPVLKWHEIPLVLSSAYEGYDMEVVRRLNPQITYRDFRARMPRSFIKGSKVKSAWGASTLSMRNTRFRLSACCLAWEDREGSDKLKGYLDSLLPQECQDANSTEGFRDLTAYEVEKAKAANKGHFLKRAGGRALDEATREARNQAEEQRLSKLMGKHEEALGTAPLPAPEIPAPRSQGRGRKRARSSLDLEDEEEITRPSKRQEWAGMIDPSLLDAGLPGDASGSFLGSDGEWQGEYPPLDMEQAAGEETPYYYNLRQLEAFCREQNPGLETDFRWIRPANQVDQDSVHNALRYTRDDCRRKLGRRLLDIRSTRGQTYAHQYGEIQEFFRKRWPQWRDGKRPELACVEGWDGGFDGWKAPVPERE